MIGRARGISPEWVNRDGLSRCSLGARLLFAYLPTIADDYGRCHASPAILAGQLFFATEGALELVPAWLTELTAAGELAIYHVRGQAFLEILDWYALARPTRFTGRQFPARPSTYETGAQGTLPFDVTQVRTTRLRVVGE